MLTSSCEDKKHDICRMDGHAIETIKTEIALSDLDLTGVIGGYCAGTTNYGGWAVMVIYEDLSYIPMVFTPSSYLGGQHPPHKGEEISSANIVKRYHHLTSSGDSMPRGTKRASKTQIKVPNLQGPSPRQRRR